MRHGTNARYTHGRCRCERCGEAHRAARRSWRARARWHVHVTAEGVRVRHRHLGGELLHVHRQETD